MPCAFSPQSLGRCMHTTAEPGQESGRHLLGTRKSPLGAPMPSLRPVPWRSQHPWKPRCSTSSSEWRHFWGCDWHGCPNLSCKTWGQLLCRCLSLPKISWFRQRAARGVNLESLAMLLLKTINYLYISWVIPHSIEYSTFRSHTVFLAAVYQHMLGTE